MAKTYYKQDLKGPPSVRLWPTLNPKRDGSPCVLKRKFGYVKTRHNSLAKAEKHLVELKESPQPTSPRKTRRHTQSIENLTLLVENYRAWLMFSIQTLDQHCRFAVARFDGSLDEIKPIFTSVGNQRTRGKTGGNGRTPRRTAEVQRLVNHYLAQLPAFIACCAVSSGISDQNDAMKLLMKIAKPVIEKVKWECGREQDEAEQLAITYLWDKTVHKFNPASEKSNMAAFNTFFTWGARRATQKRTKNDAAPGEIKMPGKDGKFVTRGTLHSRDEDSDSALFHPGTYDEDPVTRAAVADALLRLTEEERSFAILRFVECVSLRQIANDNGISVYIARNKERAVSERLRELLCDFAVD